MPELRQELITGRWVAIATERAKRPSSFTRAAAVPVAATAQCPFCPGHEAMTPPEVMAYRAPGNAPNTPGWEIRVVPNLYPAFGPPDGETNPRQVGPYQTMNGVGAHEVLIAGPDHYLDLADLPVESIAQVLRSYVDRMNFHRANPRIKYLLLINNHGKEAGASLEHPHSQLFGIPLVPPNVQEELDGVERHRREHGTCGYCDILAYEQAAGERVVFDNELFLVFAPFASRTPFELMILPRWHTTRFEVMTEEQRRAFAEALHQAVARVTRGLNDPPFNFYIHTAPTQATDDLEYHWHLELLPKLSIAAGFELGSGVMINVATPEAAAEFLRAVDLTSSTEQPAAPGLH